MWKGTQLVRCSPGQGPLLAKKMKAKPAQDRVVAGKGCCPACAGKHRAHTCGKTGGKTGGGSGRK